MSKKNKSETSSSDANDFEAWTESAPRQRGGKRCVTCAYGQVVCDYIRRFMTKRINGETRKSNSEFFEWLVKACNYEQTSPTLNRHIRECEDELYTRMRAADLRNGLVRNPSKLDKELRRVAACQNTPKPLQDQSHQNMVKSPKSR